MDSSHLMSKPKHAKNEKIDRYFKDICYLIRDNLKAALTILDDADDEDSEYVRVYMKAHGVSRKQATKAVSAKASELGELSDAIAEEYEKFLKNLHLSEDKLADLKGIDTMKEIWFGDYYGSDKYEALDDLVSHLKDQKKKLTPKKFKEMLKEEDNDEDEEEDGGNDDEEEDGGNDDEEEDGGNDDEEEDDE